MAKNHKENDDCKKSFTVSKLFNESKKKLQKTGFTRVKQISILELSNKT